MADDSKLSPQPEPDIEPGEPNPGGADAIVDTGRTPIARDLDPKDNPAVDDELPDEIAEPDDKSQEPEGEADDQESGSESDPEAGQEAEDGSVEPPA